MKAVVNGEIVLTENVADNTVRLGAGDILITYVWDKETGQMMVTAEYNSSDAMPHYAIYTTYEG